MESIELIVDHPFDLNDEGLCSVCQKNRHSHAEWVYRPRDDQQEREWPPSTLETK